MTTNPFDTELNETAFNNTVDSTSMAISDVVGGGLVATAVDIGSSLWNSLPFLPEVDTADMLSRISGNALQVYQENPDAIHTASFIGGLAVPIGASAKVMGGLRAGMKGYSWFGNTERASDLAKIAEAVDATKSYRDIARGLYTRTAVNQAVDAVAAELAIVGLMNAHPFMEDYMKDFGSNFTISAMLGAGLGSGIGVIADRFAIKQAAGTVTERVFDTVTKEISPAFADMTNSLRLQATETSIKNLDNLIQARKEAGKTETDDLTFAMAQEFQLKLKTKQVEMFEDMISSEIKALPKEEKDAFMRTIISKPEMLGVENVRLLTEKEILSSKLVKPPQFGLETEPHFIKITSPKGPIKETKQEVVFFPELGLYGLKGDAIHYADASVFGKTKEQLSKELPSNYAYRPNYDSSLELLSKSSADVQKEYIQAWEKVSKLTPKEFARIHIGEDDAALINAVLWRQITDAEVAGIKIKVSNNLPVMKQIVKEHVEKLVQEGKITAQQAANIGPDAVYYSKMEKIGEQIATASQTVTKNSLIREWINGPGKAELSKLAHDHYLAEVGGYGKAGVEATNVRKFEAIYNSAESKQLRAKFAEIADAEGYVYLYRGLKTNEVRGQGFLESMTTHYQKAAQFTGNNTQRGIKLYKVHTDDIVTAFKDVGPGPAAHNAEIIVRATARPVIAELSDSGKMALKKAQDAVTVKDGSILTTKTTILKESVEEGVKKYGPEELSALFVAQKQEALDILIGQGMPFESIALKTNTDLNVVKAYAMIKQSAGLDTLIPPNQSPLLALNKIKRYDEIDEALKTGKQPLVLSTNLIKNPLYLQSGIALDAKNTRSMNKEFSAMSMWASKSEAAKQMADVFYHPEGLGKAADIILARIGAINNEKAGSAFFNSIDAFTRNMGDVGPAISAIGKEVQRIAASTIAKVMRPIEEAMIGIQKDPAALVEFSTFYNVNAGLKGWRGLDKEGYLVQRVMKDSDAGKVEVLERVKYRTAAGENEYRVTVPAVRQLIDSIQSQSTELRELANTINRLKGTPDISDIGLWMPSFNPVDKFIAYVHDTVEQTTKLVWARTEQEFDQQLKALQKGINEAGNGSRYKVVTKDQQADWNLLNGRLDPIHMERADVAMQKGGSSAAAIVKPDLSLLGEIAKGYEFYITAQVRNLADLNLYEITDTLRKMSDYNKRFTENQPFSGLKKIISKPKDSAAIMRNVLLGSTNLGEYGGWQTANRTFEVGVSMANNFVSSLYNEKIKPLLNFKKDGTIEIAGKKKLDYANFNKELEARGIQYPWKGLDEAQAKELGFFNIEQGTDQFKRLIYGGNALAATLALRFGEIAQPIVNAMSMPILTGLAIAQKMPETFLGVQKSTANVYPVQVMYEGIRAMHSPHFTALNKRWEAAGMFKPMVSEVTDVLRATRRFDKGAVAAVENLLDSKFVQVLSKPSDLTESLTRKVAMNTGAILAKRLYPELDDAGVTIFARDFMDKSIGNFHAAQRPVMFQGTLGVALGLFQTYMWTMGQSVYRHLEHGNYKAIGKAALMQSSIFGAGSLPGFDLVSNMIADKFSDDNVDLMTGTYRATGDTLGDFIMYGLPSNLPIGASFSTRGDISPRFPISPDQMVSVNFMMQAAKSVMDVASALDAQSPDLARSLGQALSMQSLSRPIARASEIATGYSITRRGNTVQTPEEVWTFQGVAARVLSTRPLEEQKLRDADHLNHVYGAMDRDNREEVMKKIRTSIRNGTLNDPQLSEAAERYFRNGGSPAGWRSAVNTAIARTEESGRETLMEKLKPNSPLHYMIDSLER